MKNIKSGLLQSLLRNFQLAAFSEKNPEFDFKKLEEIKQDYKSSRRKFLADTSKAALLLGIGSVLSFDACTNDHSKKANQQNKSSNKSKPDIAIIGAGIAGLNCAYQLKKQGYDSKIYEADKRVGGRINTAVNILGDGLTTELGAEFIDSDHEEMLSLCKEFNLELFDFQPDKDSNHLEKETYFFHDKKYSEEEVFHEFRKVAGKILHDKKSCAIDYTNEASFKLDNTNLEEYIHSLSCSKWLKEILITAYIAEYGTDASEQSSLNFISLIDTENDHEFNLFGESDERYKIKGGNHKIIEALQSNLTDQIFTEYALTEIKSIGKKYSLIFSNGKEIQADHVVIAIPFTVLRKVKIEVAEMTAEKLKCINELGYGQNNKILIGFNNRPWRENNNHSSGYLINDHIQNGWDNSWMQYDNKGAGGYTVFIGGKNSIALAKNAKDNNEKDNIPEAELQKYLSSLDKVFPKSKSQFNGKYKAVFWSNNPFVNASYACYKPGQWTSISGEEIKAIGNVHFAGEHCSADYQGFMNGGAETGKKAAEEIVKQLANEKISRLANVV